MGERQASDTSYKRGNKSISLYSGQSDKEVKRVWDFKRAN